MIFDGSLDGIHYAIQEPRPFSKAWSSHKRGGKPALSYEIGLSIHRKKIKWLNGPFPAGTSDATIFKKHGLMAAIREKQQQTGRNLVFIADDGYFEIALLDCLSLRNEFDPREVAYFKDRSLSRHESLNGKTKNYRCLRDAFRHSHELHCHCVESICVTLQLEMDNNELDLLDAYP